MVIKILTYCGYPTFLSGYLIPLLNVSFVFSESEYLLVNFEFLSAYSEHLAGYCIGFLLRKNVLIKITIILLTV